MLSLHIRNTVRCCTQSRVYGLIGLKQSSFVADSRPRPRGSLSPPGSLCSPDPRRSLTIFKANMSTLESLKFDNLALRSLPIDPQTDNYCRTVSGACFSKVQPTPVENPEVLATSAPAMSLLGLSKTELERKDLAEYFSGNKHIPGTDTAAHCYCGHQFGYFSGQLGDGAAMYLGEVLNDKGERWEIQFKGAGLTPYSRQADGRKVLRSSVREFLCSEAMHHLGIPSTRAGTCVTSSTKVIRDIFYTGDPIEEKATIILRIAPTFIRFGSFEIFKTMDPTTGRVGPSVGRKDILKQLLEYTIKTFYSDIWTQYNTDSQKMYVEFYKELVRRTARLVADWQCVGWCHGVLNTDNMSIVGVTIDYGPFGFIDGFDPDFICNASDDNGRYTYSKQPAICRWNCMKLAEALAQIVPELEESEPFLAMYDAEYERYYTEKMQKKLGLLKTALPDDSSLIESLFTTMAASGADFTNTFRSFSRLPLPGSKGYDAAKSELLEYLLTQCSTLESLKDACKPKMDPRQLQMLLMMMQMNPGLLQQLGANQRMLVKELDRMERAKELKDYTEEKLQTENREKWTKWLDQYTSRLTEEAKDVGDLDLANKERSEVMNSCNPRFILRNYIAQNAIELGEKGDFSEIRRVLKLLETPYSDDVDLGNLASPVKEGGSSSASVDDADAVEGAQAAEAVPVSCHSYKGTAYDDKPPTWSATLRVT